MLACTSISLTVQGEPPPPPLFLEVSQRVLTQFNPIGLFQRDAAAVLRSHAVETLAETLKLV